MFWLGFGRAFVCGLCLGLVLLMTPGCAEEPLPKTYTVKGKVVYKNGKPCSGGSILFSSIADPELRGYGNIGKDGTFTLGTITRNSKGRSKALQGAVEGEFRVTVRFNPGNTDNLALPSAVGGKPAFTLSKTYKIEAKDDNELTVVIK